MPTWTAVVNRWFAAFNAHDVRALQELAHPALLLVPPASAATVAPGTVFRGHAGLASLVGSAYQRWPMLRAEPGRLTRLGPAALVTVDYVLDGSGSPVARQKGVVGFTLEDDLIVAIHAYDTEGEARAHVERNPMTTLTARQRKILALLAKGLTADEVARELVLAPSTVRTHIAKLKERLGARNIGHAIAISLREHDRPHY